jgi:hypothetical protein
MIASPLAFSSPKTQFPETGGRANAGQATARLIVAPPMGSVEMIVKKNRQTLTVSTAAERSWRKSPERGE